MAALRGEAGREPVPAAEGDGVLPVEHGAAVVHHVICVGWPGVGLSERTAGPGRRE